MLRLKNYFNILIQFTIFNITLFLWLPSTKMTPVPDSRRSTRITAREKEKMRAEACWKWGWAKRLTWRDGSESDSRLNLLRQTEPSRIRCFTFRSLKSWTSHWSLNISITSTVSYPIDRSGPVRCIVINFNVFKKHSVSA